MRNIAVIGAGGVGSLVGGLLTEAGHKVTLIDLWPPHVDFLKAHNLYLRTGPISFVPGHPSKIVIDNLSDGAAKIIGLDPVAPKP